MSFTDLNHTNDWIPVQYTSDPLLRDVQTSAVESVARKVTMTSDQVKVPRFAASGIDVVAEGAQIPLKDATPDSVVLDALKFADRFAVSSEDSEDAIVDAMNAYKREWLSNFAIALDNACLGTTAAANGTTVPFNSVYETVGSGRILQTAGNVTFEDFADVLDDMETNRKGGLVIIAHPAFKMQLRDLKDAAGLRVAGDQPINGGVPDVFGYPVTYSYGARTSATFSDSPTGNPLLIVANRSALILGVRSGPEAKVSNEAQWANDNIELKMRARRAFTLADASNARVIELTAGA